VPVATSGDVSTDTTRLRAQRIHGQPHTASTSPHEPIIAYNGRYVKLESAPKWPRRNVLAQRHRIMEGLILNETPPG
jgi:hypothetical protein